MAPEILKTVLLGEWVIVTRKHVDKRGIVTTSPEYRYPIPKEVLETIAFDWLIKEAEGCEKGYRFELTNKDKNEVFKVTVERVKNEK